MRRRSISYSAAVDVIRSARADVIVIAAFKAKGGDGARWQAHDWSAMVDALSRAEDRMERWTWSVRRSNDRDAVRSLRRRLEALCLP